MRFGMMILFLISTMSITLAQSWEDSLRQGNEKYKAGSYQEAYSTLLEAQKNAPVGVDLSKDIGNAAYRVDDYELAEKAFRSAATSEVDPIRQSQQWHNVGNTQMQKKDYKEAIESYKQALRLNPNNEETRYNLAEAQRRLKAQQEQQQNNQNNQDNKDNQNQDNQDNKDNQGNNKQDNKDNKDNQNNPQNNPSDGEGNPQKPEEDEGKLSDRKSERMIEDLLKQEMETKRKMQGREGQGQGTVKSGKQW